MLSAAQAPAVSNAGQRRIIDEMTGLLRARLDQLPVLIPAPPVLGKVEERNVTLNRDVITVGGQRFDGVVVTAPAEKASFAWAFATPPGGVTWYILPEKGVMKGFENFLRRPRAQFPSAADLKPQSADNLTFQKLDRAAWSPNERYILWFSFTDDVPVEVTLRAGFFARASLNNNALPALLLPTAAPAANTSPAAAEPKNP